VVQVCNGAAQPQDEARRGRSTMSTMSGEGRRTLVSAARLGTAPVLGQVQAARCAAGSLHHGPRTPVQCTAAQISRPSASGPAGARWPPATPARAPHLHAAGRRPAPARSGLCSRRAALLCGYIRGPSCWFCALAASCLLFCIFLLSRGAHRVITPRAPAPCRPLCQRVIHSAVPLERHWPYGCRFHTVRLCMCII